MQQGCAWGSQGRGNVLPILPKTELRLLRHSAITIHASPLPHTPFGSEGTCKGLLVQPPAINKDILNYIMQLRAPSNLTMDVSTYGPLTTSLGNLIRCFPILIIKSFFLVSFESLNLPHNKPHELEETLKTVLKYRDGDVTQEEGGSEGNGL